MLRLQAIERPSPGHYPVAGKYNRGVQTDVSCILLRKLDNRQASIKQSGFFFFCWTACCFCSSRYSHI